MLLCTVHKKPLYLPGMGDLFDPGEGEVLPPLPSLPSPPASGEHAVAMPKQRPVSTTKEKNLRSIASKAAIIVCLLKS